MKWAARGAIWAAALWLGWLGTAGAEIRVVATVAPIHSLAARVMLGAGAPDLLLPPGASPHGYALKPSQAAMLDAAQVVFRVGGGLEPWMDGPLAALAADALVVALARAPGVVLSPARAGGVWTARGHGAENDHAAHEAEDDHAAHGAENDHAAGDPHIWLDPQNAEAICAAMAEALAQADPDNAALYRANAQAARTELAALSLDVARIVAPVTERPYIVFHDAYQYFEARFGLGAIGSVSLSDADPPGPARLTRLRAALRASGAACVFVEPQFQPKLAATVIEGTQARIGVLDPLGAALTPGPGLYPALIRNLATALAECLGR